MPVRVRLMGEVVGMGEGRVVLVPLRGRAGGVGLEMFSQERCCPAYH